MPTTDPAFRSIPAGGDTADLTRLFQLYSATDVGLVPVSGRTQAEQVRAELNAQATTLGQARKPVLVLRADTSPKRVEVHPNTGASGEGWLVVSAPEKIWSTDVWINTGTGGADDYTIHDLFKETFGPRVLSTVGSVEVNLTGDRPTTFDTGNVAIGSTFNKVPTVVLEPYISPAGQVVTAKAVAKTTSTFQIRTSRPSGYNPGAIAFAWAATGEVGSAWNGGL